MTKIATAVKDNIPFWLCLSVYVWALEFQAVITLDPEPLFDRIVDCAAVLLALAFWGITASLTVAVVATLFMRSNGAYFSKLICQAGIILSTGFYFTRWLKNWSFLTAHEGMISVILLLCCIILAIWVLLRYKRGQIGVPVDLPSLNDCFRFGALPVLFGSLMVVGFQVVKYSIQPASIGAREFETILRKKESARPNVILIVADALRAKSMSLYGYPRETTPYLERLALRSTVYTQMRSNITATQISLTTLLTGKHPLSHGRLSFDRPPYRSEENLLKILTERGYNTAAVTTLWDASLYVLGFSEFLSVKEKTNFHLPSLHGLQYLGVRHTKTGTRMRNDLFGWSLPWLGVPIVTESYLPADANFNTVKSLLPTLTEPFFLFVHVMEPHEPYTRPPPFQGLYSSNAPELLQKTPLVFNAYYRPEDQPAVNAYSDQYDETIKFLDHVLGLFIDFLDDAGWGDNLLLIFTSDHGESFEHGYLGHGDDLHEPSTHVPLIIKWPSQTEGKIINDPVQSIDVAPTILDTLGIPVPPWMDGQTLNHKTEVKSVDTIALNHQMGLYRDDLPNQLAIWSKQHKVIVNCESGRIELFDLSTDPEETTNLASQDPVTVKALKTRLNAYLQKGSGKLLRSCLKHVS